MSKKIPLITVHHSSPGHKICTTKRPLYTLRSSKEEAAVQKKIAKTSDLGFWYGINCEKCCGVYPKFFTETGFEALGYYVCLVYGKESKHNPMSWQSRDAWNNHKYSWVPTGYQYSLFEEIW